MTVANLFARIGLKTDEAKAKSFNNSMKAAKATLIGVTAVAAGAALAIRKISKEAMEAAVSLKQMNVETGVSTTQLQKWQQVAEQTNQSAESVNAAIKAITSNQEKIRLGQGNISGFQILGIDPTQDPFDILEQLRTKTEGLSEAMKRNILAQTGVGAGMLQTLSLSREEFDAMASRAFIISPQAIETLNQTKATMDHAARGIQYLKTQIAVGLAPQIKKTTELFLKFIKANEEGIIKGFQKAFDILSKFIGAVMNVGRLIDNLTRGVLGAHGAIKLLLGVVVAMNAAFLLSPMGLFIAGIILLVALIDDLAVYAKGEGKSVFGELMKNFPALEGGLKDMIDGFVNLAAAIKAIWTGDYTGGINEMIESWGIWGDILKGIVDSLRFIKEGLTGELSEKMVSRADELRVEGREGAADVRDFFAGQIGSDRQYDAAPGFMKQDWWKQVFSGGGFENVTAAEGRANQNIDIEINVNGVQDPAAVAAEVQRQQQAAINAASGQRGRDE